MARRRTLTPEETSLWRRAMRTTEPLPGQHLPEPPPPQPAKKAANGHTRPTPPSGIQAPQAPPHPKAKPSKSKTAKPSAPDPLAAGLDAATARRVRRGRVAVDVTIDLHGMRQADAHAALTRFITAAVLRGARCALVITGKGGRADHHDDDAPFMRPARAGDGILRRQVPLWLRDEPLRSRIFAVERAHQRDGGGGALYVFLKRPDKAKT